MFSIKDLNTIPKSRTRLYKIWHSVKMRCRCKTCKDYPKYGGRGIEMCEEWLVYENFANWAIVNGYDPNAPRMQCQLDRIDNDGNYCPENCRFTDPHTQRMNQGIASTNTSGYKCIKYHKPSKQWRVVLNINREREQVGSFKDKKDAVDYYNKYIVENNLKEYKIQEWKG